MQYVIAVHTAATDCSDELEHLPGIRDRHDSEAAAEAFIAEIDALYALLPAECRYAYEALPILKDIDGDEYIVRFIENAFYPFESRVRDYELSIFEEESSQ